MARLPLAGAGGLILFIGKRFVVIHQDAVRRPVEIFVLARFHGPQEGDEPQKAHRQRDRYQPEKRRHLRASLKALSVTMIEDADMAIAAIRGVTNPNTASGTASML